MEKRLELNKENIEDILPFTPTQEGMLFYYLQNLKSRQYYVTLMLTLKGYIDFDVMKEAWYAVAQTNEVLRSIFRWEKLSKPIQIILKKHEIPFREYDLSSNTEEEKMIKVQNIKEEDRQETLDISQAPMRITLCRLEKDKCVMIITNHHILYDGWSNGIIYKELLDNYHKILKGQKLPHVSKPKYKEFINCLAHTDHTRESQFWSTYLQNLDTKTQLPYSKNKLENFIQKTSEVIFTMDENFQEKLLSFIRKKKVTLAAFIYCAWGILLQKYSGTKDVVFGTTVSGRNHEINNIENLVGLFINTIPLRVTREKNDTVLSLLNKTANSIMQCKEYENTALTEIVKVSEIKNSELFDSIIVLENYPIEKTSFTEQNIESGKLDIIDYSINEMTNYDLTLTVMLGDCMSFHLVYNSMNFDKQMMQSLTDHFKNVLNIMLSDPNRKISDIDVLSQDERKKLLYTFNNTFVKYNKEKLVHTLIEEQVLRTPQATAVVCGEKKITYEILNQKSNLLAWKLKSLGAGRNQIVGIMINRSIDMLIAMLGIMKAGASYLPLDPEYPQERIKYILQNSGCSVVLTQIGVKQNLDCIKDVIYMDKIELEQEMTNNPPIVNSSEDLIYLIYSSGSTGQPKGIMLTHQSVHNFINGASRIIDFNENKAIISVTTISFDIFVIESLLSLAKGLRIILATEEEQMDPKLIDKLIIEQEANMINTTPSRIKMMIESGYIDGLKTLKDILIGGESFPENLLKKLNEFFPGRIYNLYGPTETTVYSTIKDLTGTSEVTIGKPIDNTQIYILDGDLKPVPIEVSGALYIGGDGLAKGYFESPQMTDEKFISSPFNADEKIYNTGDIAKWLPNGDIYYIGRSDTQIKIRGYRGELSEIEIQLLKMSGISEAVAILKKDQNDEDSIWAFIVSKKKYTNEELGDALSQMLPHYMIPSHFILLSKLPLLPNGKIDKKVLMQYEEEESIRHSYQAPENELQHMLSSIWAEVLGIDKEKISINDRFFDIGGDSIKLVRTQLKIEQLYPDTCQVADLFTYRTIKNLSEFIMSKKSDAKEKLSFDYVELPEEYFNTKDANKEQIYLQHHIDEEMVIALKNLALSENKTYEDVLSSIYVYLISELACKKEISVQMAIDHYSFNKLVSINLNFEQINNFSEVLESIESSYRDNKNSYELKQLLEMPERREDNCILPLIYIQECFDFKNEYSQYFDLALGISNEDHTMLTLKYSYKRIRKEKAKEIFENYIQLVEAIVKQYNSEK